MGVDKCFDLLDTGLIHGFRKQLGGGDEFFDLLESLGVISFLVDGGHIVHGDFFLVPNCSAHHHFDRVNPVHFMKDAAFNFLAVFEDNGVCGRELDATEPRDGGEGRFQGFHKMCKSSVPEGNKRIF